MPDRKMTPSSWRYLASRAKSRLRAIVPLESAQRGVADAAVDVHDTEPLEAAQLQQVTSPRDRARFAGLPAGARAASPGGGRSAAPSSPARIRAEPAPR